MRMNAPGRKPASSPGHLRHVMLLVVLAAVWGSSFMAIKVGVGTIPPLTLTAGRLVLAAALLYAFIRLGGHALPAPGPVWGQFLLIAVFGNGLPFALISWGEVRIDSGLAAILMAIMPLTTLVLAHLFVAAERMTAPRVLGVVLGFGGVVVLVGPDALAGLGGDVLRQLAVAGGAVCYAVAAIVARRLPPSDPAVCSAAVMICASLAVVPVALAVEEPWTVSPSAASLLALAYLGLAATAAASIVFFVLIAARGATFLSFINYLIPVMGVVWGVVLLDERLSSQGLAALVLILAGVAIASVRPRRR